MTSFRRTAVPFAACALLLASGLAQAQSSVSISGLIDIGAYRDFDKTKKVGTIQRSNIAFSGSEDLGDGMAATFMLSHRFDADTGRVEGDGAKPFWHGEASVGLKGGWGALRLGRALDVISANYWAFDPWYAFNRIASPSWHFVEYNYAANRASNNGSAEYNRLNNGVFYDSPTVAGFSAHVSGSFEKSDGATKNNAGLSLNYNQNGVSLMLASTRNGWGDTETFAGAKYASGAWSVMGSYDQSTYKGTSADSKAKTATLGATYRLGQVELKAGYGRIDVDGVKGRFVGLGADYALSKRTTLYASLGSKKAPSLGASSQTAYGAGLAHSF
ncbi:porin [Pelomonas sp. CA6]|uniref:porin n=1 Tax=Pelomonas sp. CA6 TaxID=2907999 RepID=UPI001F4BDE22|nr:porin [Pelomonas sp. CA6]MCH7343446.1 porin [Pelomonas sp. CA6]